MTENRTTGFYWAQPVDATEPEIVHYNERYRTFVRPGLHGVYREKDFERVSRVLLSVRTFEEEVLTT